MLNPHKFNNLRTKTIKFGIYDIKSANVMNRKLTNFGI